MPGLVKIRYCSRCGKELKLHREKRGFSPYTGEQLWRTYTRCPSFWCHYLTGEAEWEYVTPANPPDA